MQSEMAGPAREPEMDDTNEVDEPIIEKWHGLVDAIRKTTKDAFPASPPFDASSPSTFQSYWRTVFTCLRQDVTANPSIPRHLTSPPVSKFTIHLFDQIHGLCCPCGHPDVDPKITLENKDGVTKEELMDGFINYMYGEKLPAVYIEPAPVRLDDYEEDSDFEGYDMDHADEVVGAALVYHSDWMSCGTNDNGEMEAYASEPNIVFYCCPPEEFVEKVKDDDEAGLNTSEGEGSSKPKL